MLHVVYCIKYTKYGLLFFVNILHRSESSVEEWKWWPEKFCDRNKSQHHFVYEQDKVDYDKNKNVCIVSRSVRYVLTLVCLTMIVSTLLWNGSIWKIYLLIIKNTNYYQPIRYTLNVIHLTPNAMILILCIFRPLTIHMMNESHIKIKL